MSTLSACLKDASSSSQDELLCILIDSAQILPPLWRSPLPHLHPSHGRRDFPLSYTPIELHKQHLPHCAYLAVEEFASKECSMRIYWTPVSQGLGSCLKCGRFSVNVGKNERYMNESNIPPPYILPPQPPQTVQLSSFWCHFPNPQDKFTWSADMTALSLPVPLHRACFKFRVGFSQGKWIGLPLDTVEPAHLNEEIPSPLLPGLSRERNWSPELLRLARLSLTPGPSTSLTKGCALSHEGFLPKTMCFPLKAHVPTQRFLNQKQWLTAKLPIKEIKLNVPLAFCWFGLWFHFIIFFTSLGLMAELPKAHSAVEEEGCKSQCDLWATVSVNCMQTLMDSNAKCQCLKRVSMACGWETAVDSYLSKCWGISRAKETVVPEARRRVCQLIPL